MSRLTLVILMAGLLWGCQRPTSPSVPPPQAPAPPPPVAVVPDPPTVGCQAPISVTTTGTGSTVTYTTPASEGGQAPVTVVCAPLSGTTFPVGSTDVRCTATDSLDRSGSCAFPVIVSRLATISKTRFLAFGDSVTVGVVATLNPSGSPFYLLQDVPNDSYPTVLRRLLAERYTSQTITLTNEGKGGEKAVDGVGRAHSAINAQRPEVVLFLDGYNDLSTLAESGIAPAITAMTEMAKDARLGGARVFIATIPPPRIDISRGISNATIVRFNEEIRAMVRGENAVLVDLYGAMSGSAALNVSDDNRHPSVAGYKKIAETFFAAIQSTFEVR